MKVTPCRKLIYRRLVTGPATTRELCAVIGQPDNQVREYLYGLVRHGAVRNVGKSFRAVWEIADRRQWEGF